jgi:hypothetical protein
MKNRNLPGTGKKKKGNQPVCSGVNITKRILNREERQTGKSTGILKIAASHYPTPEHFLESLMRTILLLILLVLLTACAQNPGAPPQATESAIPTADLVDPTAPVETAVLPDTSVRTSGSEPEGSLSAPTDLENLFLVASWSPQNKQNEIYPLDLTNGGALPGYDPLTFGNGGFLYAFSQDGGRLAVITFQGQFCDSFMGGSRCRGGRGELRLVELPSWKVTPAEIPLDGAIDRLAYSPDSALLALATTDRDGQYLAVLDGSTGEILTQRALDFPAELLAFSADSRSLVVYGTPVNEPAGMVKPDPPRALLVDAGSLDTLWEQELTEILSGQWCMQNCEDSHELLLFADWRPAVVLSPDGEQLYIVHADEDRLTTLDFASREVRSTSIQEKKSWIERLLALTARTAQAKAGMEGALKLAALSPDGKTLYTAGFAMHARPDEQHGWIFEEEAVPLQAIDAGSGMIVASQPAKLQGIHGLRYIPDGSGLLVDRWSGNQVRTTILDTRSLEPIKEIRGWDLHPVEGPDGTLTWLGSRPAGSRTKLAVLDPETFEPVQELEENGSWLTP